MGAAAAKRNPIRELTTCRKRKGPVGGPRKGGAQGWGATAGGADPNRAPHRRRTPQAAQAARPAIAYRRPKRDRDGRPLGELERTGR